MARWKRSLSAGASLALVAAAATGWTAHARFAQADNVADLVAQTGDLDASLAQVLHGAPFAMLVPPLPNIVPRVYDITEYGAKPGIGQVNTEAIQAAIDAASQHGGGIVDIPPGYWVTGPIVLKSHVDLNVESGAQLQFSGDHDLYPLVPSGSSYTVQSPISATDAVDVAITGHGVIDGAGNTWRPVEKSKLSADQWNALVASGGVVTPDGSTWWPTAQGANAQAYIKAHPNMTYLDYLQVKDYLRPYMVYFQGCQGVWLQGVTFENSPFATVKVNTSKDVVIDDVNIRNPWYGQNTDGIDVSADDKVVLYRDVIDTGDDGIALESSGNDAAGVFNEQDVVVADCIVHNGHSGFAVGSYTDGGIRDVWVTGDVYDGTESGLRFKSGVGKGGLVEDIYMDHIVMRDISGAAITFDDGYVDNGADTSSLQAPGPNSYVPQFENMTISNVSCEYAGQSIYMNGLPNAPISNITLSDVSITADQQPQIQNTSNLVENQVQIQSGVTMLGEIPH
ncbi:glycoside hydrolase family 28 protein [Alicyclobacillus mali (ex Roth et al. 2021)]|uniref:glycoside hydrolase family 28 protein n=1 Tax=Alicyclobacillus mali (ex Roth et al. 2021) TaxID=1123961 RepID=UPI000832FD2B|nr:glycoside hydrolase family 28 protein [Alicyclobacillus mali (ex Roth et al. 2021)]